MFRDLKEYQEIQKIYEERVCITEEERYITKELKETFTEDEISFIAENTEEVFTEIGNQLAEEGFEITEEAIDEMAKAITKVAVPLAKGMAKAAGKLPAKKVAGGLTKKVAAGGLTKKVAAGGGTIAKKGIPTPAGGGGGLMQKAGGLMKKVGGFVKKNVGKIATAVGAGGAGGAIGAALTKSKPKVERDSSGKIIPSTDSIRKGSDRVGGGNAGASTDSGGTQGKGGAPVTTSSAPQKKMHSIEKKNRARFGDKHVDKLKSKNADFKLMRKGEMSKADFIKKYPKSITAQKEAGLRDHKEYDAYDIVLEYLLSSQQAATIEEANHIMIEMDAKTIQSIVAE